MSMIQATAALYRDTAAETARAIPRSLWPTAFLLGAFVATVAMGMAMAPFGMAGGFVLGALEALLVGWYLALLQIAVVGRRQTRFADLRETFGVFFWETISVLFVFFVGQLLLQLTVPAALLILIPIANVVFNPVPEMIYQERSTSTELILDAARFMQNNWPEWLAAHLVPAALLGAWGLAVTGAFAPAWVLDAVTLFGPFFQFMHGGALAVQLAGRGPVGIASFFGLFAVIHVWMIFRGNLYKRLRTSSRRSRAWQARLS